MKKLISTVAFAIISTLAFSQDYRQVQSFVIPEAKQGVAVDDKHFYAIDNQSIIQYSREGDSLRCWRETDKRLIKHLNAGIVYEGLLYCAHSNFPDIPMASSIEIFDAKTLTHVKTVSLGIDVGSCTWVIPTKDCFYVFFAHYDRSGSTMGGQPLHDNSWSQLVQFDKSWRRQQAWILPQELLDEISPLSLSGGLLKDGKLYCTGHDAPKCYVLQFPPYGMRLQWVDTISVPFKGQSMAIDSDGYIWGIDRKQSLVIKSAPVKERH